MNDVSQPARSQQQQPPPEPASQSARAEAAPPRPAAPAAQQDRVPARPDDHLRVTSAQRGQAEELLRTAVDDGAIDLDEYGQRYRALLDARTRGHLRRVVHDLPGGTRFANSLSDEPDDRAEPDVAIEEGHRWHVAILSDHKAEGDWRPTSRTTAVAVLGSAKMDLREALRPGDEIAVNAVAVLGDVELTVLPGTDVQLVSGAAVLGDRKLQLDRQAPPNDQRVRLNATAVLGDVKVRSRPLEEDRSRRPRRRRRRGEPAAHAAAMDASQHSGSRDRRRRGGRITGAIAAVAIAGGLVLGAGALPAGVSVLGSSTVQVPASQLADGPVTVDAYTLMGSTTVVVPEGTQVQMGGVNLFGSSNCDACAQASLEEDAPVVRVRGVRLFGSVNVETPSTAR